MIAKSAVLPLASAAPRPEAGTSPSFVTTNAWLGGVALPSTASPKSKPGVGLIERSAGARPVPETGAVTVPPGVAVRETLSAAARRAAGSKTIANVQLAPAASEAPVHPSAPGPLWSRPESSALSIVPVGTPPLLGAVKVAGALALPIAVRTRLAPVIASLAGAGTAPVAVPVSAADTVDPGAVTVTVPLLDRTAGGLKIAATVQEAPGASALPAQPFAPALKPAPLTSRRSSPWPCRRRSRP